MVYTRVQPPRSFCGPSARTGELLSIERAVVTNVMHPHFNVCVAMSLDYLELLAEFCEVVPLLPWWTFAEGRYNPASRTTPNR
jgi:hypothetical protein